MVAPPGTQNLISLSPIKVALVYEVTWLWLKYFLLYRGNKNPEGRMDGRSDGRQLLSCSLLRRKIGIWTNKGPFHLFFVKAQIAT